MAERTNPYIAGAPVTDQRMFFGREDVFTWIEENISGRFSENMLVIHGQRRVGKTSVLKQLKNRLPENYIPVFFDFQGRTNTTINQFLYRLAREITRTLEREYGMACPKADRESFEKDAEQFAGEFIPRVKEALGEKNLVLVFDEFDTLEERTARDMLGQYLVPYFSRMMHGAERLNFIFSIGSSGHKLEDMRAEYTDFFRLALYKRISFLDAENAGKLITDPVAGLMTYSGEAVERIVELTSGHPYYIQLICHELFAAAQRTDDWEIGLTDIEEVLPDVIERGTVNLKFMWDVASGPERYALAALAELEGRGKKEEILEVLGKRKVRISGEEIGEALVELNTRDVLAKDNSFTVGLMKLWLLENRPLSRVVEELAEKHPVAIRFTQIGDEYREQGQVEGALENYRSALEQAPGYLPALLAMGQVYEETDRWLEAAEAYRDVLELDGDQEEAKGGLCACLVALGDAARESGDVEGAVEEYRAALEVTDGYLEARERLASLYLGQAKEYAGAKKWGKAGEALLEAWHYVPGGADLREEKIEGLDELQEAVVPLEKSISTLRGELAKEHLEKAVQLREGKKFAAALLTLKRALAYDPGLEEIEQEIQRTREAEKDLGLDKMLEAGKNALRSQRWNEAVSIFQRALELDLEDSGQTEEIQGMIEGARLQEELAERYAAARQALDRGVARRAVGLFREILDLEDGYRDAVDLLEEARAQRQKGRLPLYGLGSLVVLAAALVGWYLFKPVTQPVETEVVSQELTEAADVEPTLMLTQALTKTATPESLPTETITSYTSYGIGSTQTSPMDGMVLVYVPEGEFLMGMPAEEHWEDAAPPHNVYLDAFWIDQTEVTNGQYQQCVAAGACRSPWSASAQDVEEYYGNPQYDDYPVVYVDWDRAQAYCEWAGRRLPTEAEWEKAARGTDGRDYPWGDTFYGSCVNYCDRNCVRNHADNSWDDGYALIAPAGNYPSGASPYGALDMAGNVGEWVVDWYAEDFYSISPYKNPQGPASGEYHAYKSGAYESASRGMRVAGRGSGYNFVAENRGFRCAVTSPVLSYVNREEIAFEDDFSSIKVEWGKTSEFTYLSDYVSNGVLSISDKLTNIDDSIIDGVNPGITFPINGMFDAVDFSLEFDFSFISTVSPEALIGVHFRSPYDPDNAYDQNIGYALDISKDGSWSLKAGDDETRIADGETSLEPEYNSLQLIAVDQTLWIFVNDELIYETKDLEELDISGKFTEIALFSPEGGIFKIDNVRYWDLEGLEIP